MSIREACQPHMTTSSSRYRIGFFFFKYFYLFVFEIERERASERSRGGAENEAGTQTSREPNAGPDRDLS